MTVQRYMARIIGADPQHETPCAMVLAADFDRLAAKVAKLREYVWHNPECSYLQDELPCTCGLEECLADADPEKQA